MVCQRNKEAIWKWILWLLWHAINWENYISNYVKRKIKWLQFNWIERTWIDVFSKETQNPFSDSFGFKNPIFDFLKETHPKCEKCSVEKYCWNETDDIILPVLHNFSELWYLFPWVPTGYCLWCYLRQLFICLAFRKRKKAVKYLNLFKNKGFVLLTLKDDFQTVLRSLRTLMFTNIINGSLDGMRIDVFR